MTVVMGLGDDNESILIVENPDNGLLTLEFSDSEGIHSIEVRAAELGSALIEASPTFATGLSEIVQRAILTTVGRND